MRVYEPGGVGILYTFGRGVSEFFTVEVKRLSFLEWLPLDGWFKMEISPIARLARAKVGDISQRKVTVDFAIPQGVYALID
jgi:hypothetical protein